MYLARTVLDDDVAVLADGAGLLRIGLGGAGVGLGLKVVLLGVRHLRESYRDPIAAVTEEQRQQEEEEHRKYQKKGRKLINFKRSESRNTLVAAHRRRSGRGDLQDGSATARLGF